MNKQSGKRKRRHMLLGDMSRNLRLRGATLALVGVVSLCQPLSPAQATPNISSGKPSIQHETQPTLAARDRKNQWFFAKAVAQSMWELAMYAERLTLQSPSERVEVLQQLYAGLMDIEGELALKRRDLADQHGITDALMSHAELLMTTEQKRAFDVYIKEAIAWHQRANSLVEQDNFIKSYYGHLLTLNGMSTFVEQLQDFLRSQPPRIDERVAF